MINVRLNDSSFQYDVYSLIKAFYKEEDLNVASEFDGLDEKEINYTIEVTEDSAIIKEGVAEKLNYEFNTDERPERKNILKRLVYDFFSEKTGKTLPWGTLTGIRPTKIATKLLEEGKSDEEIFQYMKETYLISDEKAYLSIEIAKNEQRILAPIDYKNGYSLYIGIPFCPSTCLYCSFTSYPILAWKDKVRAYLDALEKEMSFIKNSTQGKNLDTIYIGGGTPTSLSEEDFEYLLTLVDKYFDVTKVHEYCVEAGRPDSITRGKLRSMKNHGVSRISVNPQTMNQKTLDYIGRHHKVEDIIATMEMARAEGIENINMDIILGLPNETLEDLKYTLEEIKKLGPDSLTAHSLAIKRSARLNTEKDLYSDALLLNSQEHMDECIKAASEMGMSSYYLYRQKNMAANLENIGFSKEKCPGIYNILIMEEKQTIIAIGAGSASKYIVEPGEKPLRSENVKDVDLYLERLDEMIDRKREKLEEISWL